MDADYLVTGVVLGGVSLLGGYVLRKLAELRAEQVSYLHQVPKFRDLAALRDHLRSSPGQRADVLVEGRVKKLGDAALISEKAGLEGAARLMTTTTYTKMYNEESGKWRDLSNTVENTKASRPFLLEDSRGNGVRVDIVHTAGGFRQLLERVYQERTQPEQRTMGDFATNVVTLKEIPNGSLKREFLLLFGTTLAGYGAAVLEKQSIFSGGEMAFTPAEVGHSIDGLISRNEVMASAMKFFSTLLLVAGSSILLFTVAPVLVGLIQERRGREREGREGAQGAPAPGSSE